MNNYYDKKRELLLERVELLKKYEYFLNEVLVFNNKINGLGSEIKNPNELMDYMKSFTDSEEMNKIFRMISALLYVEKPCDKEVIEALKENITISVKKNRRK